MLGSCVLFCVISGGLCRSFAQGTNTICSWILVSKEACLVILMFLYLFFCVKLLWEFNPNRAKSLQFGGVQKAQEGPWFDHKRAPFVVFCFCFLLSLLFLCSFLSLDTLQI